MPADVNAQCLAVLGTSDCLQTKQPHDCAFCYMLQRLLLPMQLLIYEILDQQRWSPHNTCMPVGRSGLHPPEAITLLA
jgi:hypothetical protein